MDNGGQSRRVLMMWRTVKESVLDRGGQSRRVLWTLEDGQG